jgi:hypothetical protein
MRPLNLLHDYYSHVKPNPLVLEMCGTLERDTPYSKSIDEDLTVIINAFARPEYLPLIWEAVQYQTRRPRETWLIQNNPAGSSAVPRAFLEQVRGGYDTIIIDSDLNHGCWFRFIVAAIYCRTRFVAIFDDDTLSAKRALESALSEMSIRPGIYGGRGITFRRVPNGPEFRAYLVSGWPKESESVKQVDFVGHLWVTETYWLRRLFAELPDLFLSSSQPGRECGEDMYLSFVAQRNDIPTFVFKQSKLSGCNSSSSLQGVEMGTHSNAMFKTGGLRQGGRYLEHLVARGWKLLNY